jgi:hypothetical protein
MSRTRVVASAAALMAIVLTGAPEAHEVPRRVVVHAYVKAESTRLRALVRVPLGAMRDIDFPQVGDGFLDVRRAEPALRDAATQWILPNLEVFEADERLGPARLVAARVSLPSDRSFVGYEQALAHVTAGTLADDTRLPWPQALLDVLVEYPITSERANFSIRPGFERLGIEVITVLRFVTPGGVRTFEVHGDPGVVQLDPRWHQAAWSFVKLGFFHVLDGVDHLLFLFCLVIPFRRLRPLILVVTAFTVAHSITLLAAAAGLAPGAAWFPPLVEMLIAASIVYMAIENIVFPGTLRRRALMAFAFGLVHGFGFSFVLGETMQFAGSHLLASLLSFNVGVEIGQVAVLVVLVPALQALLRFVISERMGAIVLSVLAGHVAWHWMVDRWTTLRQFPPPSLETVTLLTGVRLMLGAMVLVAAVWLVRRIASRSSDAARGRALANNRTPTPNR